MKVVTVVTEIVTLNLRSPCALEPRKEFLNMIEEMIFPMQNLLKWHKENYPADGRSETEIVLDLLLQLNDHPLTGFLDGKPFFFEVHFEGGFSQEEFEEMAHAIVRILRFELN